MVGLLAGWSLLVMMICVSFNACKKEAVSEPFVPSRYFAPGGVSVSAPNVTVTLMWNRPLYASPEDALAYTVEVARDASFQQIEKSLETEVNTVVFANTELVPEVSYVARIKVNAANGKEASNWTISEPFSLTAP
ncbi:MAG: hypothetical protein EAS52_09090 [Parapedobacter sp.]|nr:MAG: hypothetical protein EAS52_09090 [Parapedobacter sp.]